MPKKNEDTKNNENQNKDGESLASTIDPQKKYLMDQFGNLMDQVGDGFGGPLQEELIKRLEQTIADFHEEVSEMMSKLKDNAEKRHEKLKEIWNNPDATAGESDMSTSDSSNSEETNEDREMSEWERKLEQAGKLGNDTNSDKNEATEEEKPKKKGFFGRKKK